MVYKHETDISHDTYEVFYCALLRPQHHGRSVVWRFALGLSVDSLQAELLPHCLHELINIPSMLRADRHRIGNTVEQVELFDANGVNLVETVNDGNIAVVSFSFVLI